MARIYSQAGEQAPEIDTQAVLDFFEARARKVETLGPTRAVIYQDKHPDLAEKRDVSEKKLLLPILGINSTSRVLDAGCGTGRWAQVVIPECATYTGTDVSPGLIQVARERFAHHGNAQFLVCPADNLSLTSIGTQQAYTHVLSFGLFIYLNDEQVLQSLQCFADVAGHPGKIMFREPIATQQRLTLKEHFSDELEQHYNAIYRTEEELTELIHRVLARSRFIQTAHGDVYADTALNNRVETKQRWFLWERT